ncbi:MAG: hypothetical protein IJ511_03375 [Bacteroides sp.]|nr:hypothetical protein [Bacteroides sp.]
MDFHQMKSEMCYKQGKYRESADEWRALLHFREQLPARRLSYATYQLALSLALTDDPACHDYFRQSIDLAVVAKDTTVAIHYMRNYADVLASSSQARYVESNVLLLEILRLMPSLNEHAILYIGLAANYLNLHLYDAAQRYLKLAWERENYWNGR